MLQGIEHFLPLNQPCWCLFLACHQAHATIKVYLAAIRYCLHAQAPLRSNSLPDGSWSLRASRELRPFAPPCSSRLPITLQIMCAIKDCLSSQPYSHSNIMLWAACCLVFFGFLRVGEFTVPCHSNYDSEMHLSLTDIALDSRDNPLLIAVSIKQSKTDPFRKGVTLYLGVTNHIQSTLFLASRYT